MIALLIPILLFLFVSALSWLVTCGLVWGICSCFGWTFSWAIGTGVWLIIWLARTIFSHITIKR